MADTYEIEKKYNISGIVIPETILNGVDGTWSIIEQSYIIMEPAPLRLRSVDGSAFYMTAKGTGLAKRKEEEWAISRWVYEQYQPNVIGHVITKERCKVPYNGFVLEIDVFTGRYEGLKCLECEFKTDEEFNAFVLPDWAAGAPDVTEDKRYKNNNLAVGGIPPDYLDFW